MSMELLRICTSRTGAAWYGRGNEETDTVGVFKSSCYQMI